ncbi:MAG TPA: ankyrin repeat domain-containing protein [Alphaproteobacteria bacterium]|nr:ankyrin repeat domain-containing protein [Alphaproteobacteria bacterium]
METSRTILPARLVALLVLTLAGWLAGASAAFAQTAPSPEEIAAYQGLHAGAAKGDVPVIERWIKAGADPNGRDASRRTPLMVAVYSRHIAAAQALIKAGADVNAFDNARYDMLTIAAVANDLAMLKLALASGANARAVTSPYDGTALIASAHLGHVEVVGALIAAKAPLDHINNLGWTALIEAIVLGDGGKRHTAIVKALIAAGANVNIADRDGARPLKLARGRGYMGIAKLLEAAGARP